MRVVVIGAGLAGITTAWFLRRSGAEVIVLDRSSGPARETSYANGSMITPSLADPWNAPGVLRQLLTSMRRSDAPIRLHPGQLTGLWRWGIEFLRNSSRTRFEASYLANVQLATFSQEVMAELLAQCPIEFEHADGGILKVYDDPADLDRGIKVGHWLKQAGIHHEVLDVEGLLRLEPALAQAGERLVGAVRFPDDEVGNARLFCEGLHELLARDGVRFQFSAQVLALTVSKGRLQSVRTPSEELAADAFVLAAGSHSAQIARKLGFRLPVVPAKGYSITVPVDDPALIPRLPVVDEALHAAVVPLGGNRLRVAGTAEFAGYDLSLPAERIANLGNLLERLYPQLVVDGQQVAPWAGLRPLTPDGRPILGASPLENLFLNTGHGALGWTLACASGRLVAETVLGRAVSRSIEPFALSRF